MNGDDWVGPVAVGAIILFFVGFFVGMGVGIDSTHNMWCKRMTDTTWSECLNNGIEVTVVKK